MLLVALQGTCMQEALPINYSACLLSSPPIVVSSRVVRGASARRAPQRRIAEVRRGYSGGPASRAMTGEPDRS